MNRRKFVKISAVAIGGVAVAHTVGVPLLTSLDGSKDQKIQTLQQKLQDSNAQSSMIQNQLSTQNGFTTLNVNEQPEVEAIVETIIPTDSCGPGAKEAGVVYFIDRQLSSDYGHSGNMFMAGPHVMPGQSGPITVGNATYSGGSPKVRVGAGTRYQYGVNMREYWRIGLEAVENYSQSAYSGLFESLTPACQLQLLTDLWNNKPTNFSGIIPEDFAYELTFMTWSGFLMDPLYGGNQNMVGWVYTGFNGVNFGNAYGEHLSQKNLMVATTPTRLKPASLAQFQQGA